MSAPFPPNVPVDLDGDQAAEAHIAWNNQELHAFAAIHFFMSLMSGQIDGVFAYADPGNPPLPTTSLKVAALGTPGMQVQIKQGIGFHTKAFIFNQADTLSEVLVAPTGNPRIDIVQINYKTQAITIKTGAEAASPSAPSVDPFSLKLAEIYHRVGESSIKDTDDASNGYITDSRTYCNA